MALTITDILISTKLHLSVNHAKLNTWSPGDDNINIGTTVTSSPWLCDPLLDKINDMGICPPWALT